HFLFHTHHDTAANPRGQISRVIYLLRRQWKFFVAHRTLASAGGDSPRFRAAASRSPALILALVSGDFFLPFWASLIFFLTSSEIVLPVKDLDNFARVSAECVEPILMADIRAENVARDTGSANFANFAELILRPTVAGRLRPR